MQDNAETDDLKGLFANHAFVRFWLARVGGTTAMQMLMVALGWHMYDITSSAWDLGLVGLFQFVPALLLTLPAGHVADRLHRARIISACMLTQALACLILLASVLGDFSTRELILGISVMLGIARAFQMPAQQAIIPQLVPPSMLQRAVTVNAGSMQAAIISGPALGGLLYTFGPSTVYSCGAILLLTASFLSFGVRYAHVLPPAGASWRGVLAGVSFVWQRKVILGATSLDLFAVLLGGATALLPIFARDLLHTGPAGLGLLSAAPAVGALSMSLVLVRWPLRRRVGHKLLAAVAVFGAATVVFGLSRNFALSWLALLVTGAADSISVVTRSTLVQLETPNEMRGRVSAVNSLFIGASNQLGEFESGSLAALWGPVASVVIGGVGTMLVAASWLKLFPALAERDTMEPKK